MKRLTLIAAVLATTAGTLLAQTLSTPPSGNNQKCMVTQYIGTIAHVTVVYNSPDVDGREGQIWGQLVPYGMTQQGFGLNNPSPWRVGANENTVIKFSHDMEVEGKPIKAGKYGLHLVVEESGDWTWIFSHNHTAWGSYFYDESEDALRVQVTPGNAEFTEWLTFNFSDRQPDAATLEMRWENRRVPMRISVPNSVELYTETFAKELQGAAGFNHLNWAAAAGFLAQNNHNLDLALEWADYAMNGQFVGVKDMTTMQTKAQVLTRMGDMAAAQEIMMEAIRHPSATPFQIHGMGRQLIAQGMADKALEVFEYSHQRFEGAWPTNVGMARGLSAVGRYADALKYAQMAHDEAPDQLNKDSMAAAIEKLRQKQDIN
ncbi:MAG: DUF2911 domain-containing protein [Saprospiraceae bacterium]|nr:DUF2911 domain-containing protein [Saprospiraceae bacterium]